MADLRRAAVAGSWYPGDAAQLSREVDEYVSAADVDPIPSHLRAVIAPHAGLMYSGPVAAFAYKLARDTNYGTIVLVGPSHFVPFRGVSIWPRGSWETPFGPIAVDEALAAAIVAESTEIVEHPAAHGREHSLEMQMPFVAHLLPGSRIVPLVMGHQTRETAEALGDALARAIAARTPTYVEAGPLRGIRPAPDDGGRVPHRGPGAVPDRGPGSNAGEPTGPRRGEVLLVASSDLSHYEDARTASAMDDIVLERVEALDPDGLMDALEREPRHACGGGPMVAVLRAARQLGAQHARVLRHADSGDVSGDKSAVVGYMAAAIW